jgi:hypothetical protein
METNKTVLEDNNIQINHNFEVEQLMGDLKEKDRQYGGMVKRLIWLYGLMIPIYLVVFLFHPDATIYNRIEGGCFVAGFTIFFVVFRYLHKQFNFVNYGEPLIQVLKSVVKRYKKWQWPTYLAFVGVLLIDIGMCFSTTSENPVPNLKTIIQFQLFFLPSITIAALIGFLIWRKRHKPLVDKAKKLLKELE